MKYSILVIFTLISTFSFSQKNSLELKRAKNQINTYGELSFKFAVENKDEINNLPRYIFVDNKTKKAKSTVFAYVHKTKFNDLLDLEIPFEVVSRDSETKSLTMATTVAQMANWDRYPTYSVYLQLMQDFATNHSDIARLETIGNSQTGRLVQVLKITDNPDVDEDEPEFFYTGQMHGNELVGSIMLLRLIDYLLTNYGSDSQVDDLINNVEIWINPLSNPDGCYHGGDNTVSGATRSLQNGVDPNRNFPAPSSDHPDGNAYAKEIIDMMAFTDLHNFILSANIHSGAEVVNYPWDTWDSATKIHADDNWWQLVSHEYADTVFANSTGGYFTDVTANGITEGGDWYIIAGGRQDYMTYFKYGREFTLELSGWKSVDASDLPDYWNYNYNSLLKYMEQTLYGIRGIVSDSVTGEPIEAKVEITSHDVDNSFVYSTLPIGNYHRMIYEGNYDVTYSKEGYDSQTINIDVSNYDIAIQNIALHPTGAAVNDFSTNDEIRIVPNPMLDNKTSIRFNKMTDIASIKIYDNLGKLIYQRRLSTINAGDIFNINLEKHVGNAVYFLKVQTDKFTITKRIIK